MKVLKGKNFIQIGEWDITLDPDYPDRIAYFHLHGDSGDASPFYVCLGDPPACRYCQKEIPKEIAMLLALQRIRLERGE